MFGRLREWWERKAALKELRADGQQDNHGYSVYFGEQIEAARVLFNQGAPDKALEVWRRMRVRFPDLTLTSEKALRLIIDLDHLDEAEALIKEGQQRYPRRKSLYAGCFARVAYRRGELEEAMRRCERVRKDFPRNVDGYEVAASCLSDLGRDADAEAMIGRAVQTLPNNQEFCARHAQMATRRLDWHEGLRRWTTAWDRFESTPAILGQAECLKQLGRLDEAEAMLRQACVRFPTNPWSFAQLAMLSSDGGQHEEAVRRWHVALDRFPGFDFSYPKAAEALVRVGRDAEADELLRVAVTRSPKNLALNLAYARSANSRGDGAAAKERWATVLERFPDCAEARQMTRTATDQETNV